MAELVWSRLGQPKIYVEPFAGSVAVLLARPGPLVGLREIVADTDGGLCNTLRALAYGDVEKLAWWADQPSVHQDLTAWHGWLRRWVAENAGRLSEDPFFFDEMAAGRWLWGISLWVGSGWCQTGGAVGDTRPHIADRSGPGVSAQRTGLGVGDQRPSVSDRVPGGRGVSAQRTGLDVGDKRPLVRPGRGGLGVNAQRSDLADSLLVGLPEHDQRPSVSDRSGRGVSAQRTGLDSPDKRPHVSDRARGGQGVSAQRVQLDDPYDKRPSVSHRARGGRGVSAQRATLSDGNLDSWHQMAGGRRTRPALLEWFHRLQERLHGVVIINRDWTSCLTPTLLARTRTSYDPTVGVFLDPPYLTDNRADLYGSDLHGSSDAAAVESYEWAVANGDDLRVAYCAHAGDFPVPDGWEVHTQSFEGINRADRHETRRDLVMFSPACHSDPQGALF